MVKLKRILSVLIVIVVIIAFALNYNRISDEVVTYITEMVTYVEKKPEIEIKDDNGYRKEYEYQFISETEDYIPNNKDELLEIFYTVLNMGWKEFTFYCPTEYTNCLIDLRELSQDKVLLANLNNFVSSYNGYDTLKTVFDTTGEVTIRVTYNYSHDEIKLIDAEIDQIMAVHLNDTMTDEEKIRTMHDYIVNNTKYDKIRAETENSQYDSERMTGLLFDGYSICTGYADTMEVILTKLGIPNYKIASDNHVWNAVYINNEWVHLDVTWDDPTTDDGSDILNHDFFLVGNDVITKDDKEEMEHVFDKNIYIEFNK